MVTSSARFYERRKKHPIITKFMKSQQFPRSTGKNYNFLELHELFTGKDNIESSRNNTQSWYVSFKLQNCQTVMKIIMTLHKNMTGICYP